MRMRRPSPAAVIKPKFARIARAGSKRRKLESFESLVDQLSGAIARVPAHEVDNEIHRWLQRMVVALDVDRGTVWERTSSEVGFLATRWWARPGIPALPRRMASMQISPWATNQILAGKSIVFANAEELPEAARTMKQFLKAYGPKAQVVLPLLIGGEVVGALSVGKFRGPRQWSPKELRRLRIVAQIISNALDRKRAVLQIIKLQEELTLASRRSTMSGLTASIAHELNQPLSAILSNLGGAARLLATGIPEPALALTAVNNAMEDTRRAAQIVRRIHFMFKQDEKQVKATDISALVAEVTQLLAGEAALRDITVTIEASPPVRWVIGDRVQLQQCVLNLLMNAFDAITEAKSERRDVTVKIDREKAGWTQVGVCDSGGGIDTSVAPRLFEPFVTTKNKGMGLGLFVTRSIVENHGGKVWPTPNPEGGSIFTFTLPAADGRRPKASGR
jgi:signal transduction histidine kinase